MRSGEREKGQAIQNVQFVFDNESARCGRRQRPTKRAWNHWSRSILSNTTIQVCIFAIRVFVCVHAHYSLSLCVCSLSQYDDMRQANRNYIEICEFRSSFRKKRKRNVRRAQSAAEFDPRALSAANKRTLFK